MRFTNTILAFLFAAFLMDVMLLIQTACTKDLSEPATISQTDCRLGIFPGIISSSMNPDGSIVYQFSKLSYGKKEYALGTLTTVNGSMKVWKSKTVFWAPGTGSSIVMRCFNASGNIIELDLLCPDECGSCDCEPPPCPKSFTVYQ